MKINTTKTWLKRRAPLHRHSKQRVFYVVAIVGLFAGLFAQTAGVVLNNVSAMSGWNWVQNSPSQGFTVTTVGGLGNKAVSKDGSTIVYGTYLGLKLSHDGGSTWTTIHPNPNKYYDFFGGVAISANGQHIWIESGNETNYATFMSHDGGATWAQKGNDTDSQQYCNYLGFVSNDGQTIMCEGSISRDGGMTYAYTDWTPYSVSDDLQTMIADDYLSTDAGVTWNQITNLPAYNNLDYSTSQVSSDGQTIAIGTYDSDTTVGSNRIVSGYKIAVSTNGGATWAMRATPGAIANPTFRMSKNGQTIYSFDYNAVVGGGIMYTSSDTGQSWTARSTRTPYYVTGFSDLWISNDGSVLTEFTNSAVTFRSADNGATWRALIDREGVTPVTVTTNGSRIFGVTSLGGKTSSSGLILPLYSDDNGATWQALYGDLASIQTTFQTCTPDKYYGEPSTQLSVSADGQTVIMPGATTTNTDCYLLSKDGGATWQTIAGPVTKALYYKILVSKTGQHLVTKSSTNKVMISHDGGLNWSTLSSTYTFRDIQSISNDGQKLTATTTTNVLLYSTNGGVSWTNISSIMSTAYTGLWGSNWSASVSGDGSRLLATDGGSEYSYVSTNDGANWTRSTSTVSLYGTSSNYYYGTWYIGQFSMSENGMHVSVSGDDGVTLTSLDGGITYQKQDTLQGTNMLDNANTMMSSDGLTLVVADDQAYFGVAKFGFNPFPITNTTATAGVEQATVTWDPASLQDGTDPVTAQELRYRQTGTTTWTTASSSISPSTTSYTVTGLTGGIQYEFQVRAENTAGGWTPWARAFAPLTSIDISSMAPNGSLTTQYALDATDGGNIWFAHDYYPCGNPASCSKNGWMLEHSSDGGATWQQNTMPGVTAGTQTSTATPHELRVSEDGKTILVTGTTMYLSRDGGVTWGNVSSIGAGRWYDIDVSTNGTYMIASEWGGANQVKYSTNAGQTWSSLTLPNGETSSYVATVRVLNNGTIYASTYDSVQPIIKSIDGGATWLPASGNLPRSLPTPSDSYEYILDGRIFSLALVDISDDGQRMTYIASYGNRSTNEDTVRYVTEDGGQTWLPLSPLTDAFAFDPELLANNDSYYSYSPAFTASGRTAYITGFATNTNYHIVFSNFSQALATPTAAAVPPTGGNTGGGASGGSTSDTTNPPVTHHSAAPTTSQGTGSEPEVAATDPTPATVAPTTTSSSGTTGGTHKTTSNASTEGVTSSQDVQNLPWWKDRVVMTWLLAIIAALIAIIIWAAVKRHRDKKRLEKTGFTPPNDFIG